MHSVKNEACSNSRDINHCFFNNFSYNYIALYNLGGIIMHRAISNYKITKRKDGRYYVRLQDGGEITHIYGKTKAEVQGKLEIKLEELNTLNRQRTGQSFPTRIITLANWAHLCLNTFCAFLNPRHILRHLCRKCVISIENSGPM